MARKNSKTTKIEIATEHGRMTVEVPADAIKGAFECAKKGYEFEYDGGNYVIAIEASEEKEYADAINHMLDGVDFIYER